MSDEHKLLHDAVKSAIELLIRSEGTGWMIYASDARELLQKALTAEDTNANVQAETPKVGSSA